MGKAVQRERIGDERGTDLKEEILRECQLNDHCLSRVDEEAILKTLRLVKRLWGLEGRREGRLVGQRNGGMPGLNDGLQEGSLVEGEHDSVVGPSFSCQ